MAIDYSTGKSGAHDIAAAPRKKSVKQAKKAVRQCKKGKLKLKKGKLICKSKKRKR